MALPVVIAKNQTASPIFLSRLGITVPASPGQETLTDQVTYIECTQDEDLITAVAAGDIIINNGTTDLTIAEANGYLESSGNLDGPSFGATTNALLKLSDTSGRSTVVTGITVDSSDNISTTGTINASAINIGGNPQVIDDLDDVDTITQAPTNDDTLRWDGTNWTPLKNNQASSDPSSSDDSNQGYSIGSQWINTADNSSWICVDASPGSAVWIPTAGSGTDNQYFDAYDSAGGTNVTSGWTDVPLGTVRISDSIFSHTAPNADVTITEQDTYIVIARVSTSNANNTRTASEMRINLNGSPVAGTTSYIYNRNSAQGIGTATVSAILSLNASDVLKVEAQRRAGTGTISLVQNGSSLTIFRIGTGASATGGNSLDVEENDSSVVSSANIINFEGNISVTDEGSGKATVTVPEITVQDDSSLIVSELSSLDFTGDGVSVVDSGGGTATIDIPGTPFLKQFVFYADQLNSPFTSDWTVSEFAPTQRDPSNTALVVRAFDDTTEEGTGFLLRVPSGASTINIHTTGRPATAPVSAATVGLSLYNRAIGDGTAIGTWSTSVSGTVPISTNANYQTTTNTFTLGALGLSAGELYQFELTRDPTAGGNLSGDWYLLELIMEFE